MLALLMKETQQSQTHRSLTFSVFKLYLQDPECADFLKVHTAI